MLQCVSAYCSVFQCDAVGVGVYVCACVCICAHARINTCVHVPEISFLCTKRSFCSDPCQILSRIRDII